MQKIVLSWSSGKDSAWTLYQLQNSPDWEVVELLTTVNQEFERVAMHAVRKTLLEEQAKAANVALRVVDLPWPCSNEDYERIMAKELARLEDQGIRHMAFGDLFLEDIRQYRVDKLAPTQIEPLFPLWQKETASLARDMIEAGVEATLTCVDPRAVDPSFAGRRFDQRLLDDLPDSVDPCGENGEFHTFVHAGPMFSKRIPIESGHIEERDGFVFADLLPGTQA